MRSNFGNGSTMLPGQGTLSSRSVVQEGGLGNVCDWVMFARYAGSRIKIEGGEIRMLNDDEVLATIKSPEDLLHEF